jgi:hypothetical protein
MDSRVATVFVLFLLSLVFDAQSQETFKARSSPLAITAMRYKDAYVKIIYSQPQKRGREIFGELVPYGHVWRTGANEATEITLTKDILVNGQMLKAGTYSIFTIPDVDKWTIIFNADVGLWGAYNYNLKADVIRIEAPVQLNNTFFEAFTMIFDQNNDVADLLIMWDNVKLSLLFKFIN